METTKHMSYGLTNNTNVTVEQFINFIVNYDNAGIGARPISFTSVTNPVHRKKGFPYAKLFKVGQTSGMLGTDYEANVNAQREKEGKTADFTVQNTSKVKEWLSKSVGVTTKDNMVIRYRPLNNKPCYWVVETEDGETKEVDFSEIKPYLYEYNGNSQGLDEQIDFRLYGVDKIIAFSFEGNEGIINDVDSERKKIFELVKSKF